MAGILRSDLRIELARLLGGYKEVKITGSSTKTVLYAQPTYAITYYNNRYINWFAYWRTDAGVASVTGVGQERAISDSVQASASNDGTITMAPQLSASLDAPANNDIFDLFPLSSTELDRAVEHAIPLAWPSWYQVVRDTTTLDTATDQHYSLPAACYEPLYVAIRSSDDDTEQEVRQYRVDGPVGARKLYMHNDKTSGYDLVVDYVRAPVFLTSAGAEVTTAADTDVLGVGWSGAAFVDHHTADLCSRWIEYAAAEWVLQNRLDDGSEQEVEQRQVRITYLQGKQRELRAQGAMPAIGPSLHSKPWSGRDAKWGSG